MKPRMSLTALKVSDAIAPARSEPSASTRSMCAGSCTRRFISDAIGESFATEMSTSADLKVENCAPPNYFSTSVFVVSASAA